MRSLRLYFLAFLFSAATLHAFATESTPPESDIQVRCKTESMPIRWTYCVTTTLGSTNKDILYYLHEGDGNVHEWDRAFGQVRKVWRKAKFAPPVVVSVDFGPRWLLVDKNSSPMSGLYGFFVHHVVPKVESEILKGDVGERRIVGMSMGGFNTIELIAREPKMFKSAVLICPMLMDLAPDATPEQIANFRAHSKDPKFDPTPLLQVIQQIIPDEKTWKKESPFVLATAHLGPSSPKMLLTYGKEDPFIDGDLEFRKLAHEKKASLKSAVVPGDQCHLQDVAGGDLNAVANFLIEN